MKGFFNWLADKKQASILAALEKLAKWDLKTADEFRSVDEKTGFSAPGDVFRGRVRYAAENGLHEALKYTLARQPADKSKADLEGFHWRVGGGSDGEKCCWMDSVLDQAMWSYYEAKDAFKPEFKKVIDLLIPVSDEKALKKALNISYRYGWTDIAQAVHQQLNPAPAQPAAPAAS